MLTNFKKSLLLTLSLILLGTATLVAAKRISAAQQRTSVEHHSKSGDSDWMWNHSDNGVQIKVHIKGQVTFNDDYTDIVSISSGGYLSLLDERGGVTRKFEVSPQADGSLKRTYWVDGVARQLDAEGQAWLTKMLLDTVRQSGYDAKARVQRILKQQGVGGVFEEISQINSDHAKKIYFVELMNNANLNVAEAQRLFQQTTREVRSDYEKAQIMTKAGERFLSNEALRPAYLEGVNSISSDYEKARVLQTLLKQNDLSKETVSQLIQATSRISSDYEKTRVFMQVAAASGNNADIYNALVEAAKSVSSDYEKARLLLKAIEVSGNNEAARQAYLEGVRSISSDFEKSRVLQALLKQEGVSSETLRQVIKLSTSISSDYEQARVLIRVAAVSSNDESIRNAIVEAAKGVSSEYERGRILNAVFK